jgi:hypothetical protein
MTAQKHAHFIDLDAIDTDVTLVVKFKGAEHKMVAISVGDFVSNMRIIQDMGVASDPQKEMSLLIDMLDKVFPTITRDALWSLTLPQLQALFAKAQEFGGMNAVTDDVKQKLQAEGNENPLQPKS